MEEEQPLDIIELEIGQLTKRLDELEEDRLKLMIKDKEIHSDNLIVKFVRISGKSDFKNLMETAKEWFKKEDKFYFLVNEEKKLHGKITNQVDLYKKKVCLARLAQFGDRLEIFFFHEPLPNRNWKTLNTMTMEFFVYLMISDKKQYYIFSDSQLGVEEYELSGTLIEPDDFVELGNMFKLPTKFPIMIVHTAKPRVVKLKSHQELFKLLDKYKIDFNRLNNYIFSNTENRYMRDGDYQSLRHPEHFEWLIDSWLFSADYDGYPLHMFWMAHPGTGKTAFEEAIHNKMKEFTPIHECSGSTLKSLVPSFKGNLPEPGYLLSANRMAIADEFLRVLLNVKSDEREQQLSRLNPLLEHRKRLFQSGNGKIEGNMTAKLLAVSNEVWGTSNIFSLAKKFDRSFLSRIFVWYQDKDHIDWVKDRVGFEPWYVKMDVNDWLSIYDYLNSFRSFYDESKINDLGHLYLDSINDWDMGEIVKEEIYRARYIPHHFHCLMDGLVKTRCLISRDASFEAVDEDYKRFKEIVKIMLKNWDKVNWKEVVEDEIS